ncbi:hypothetical protein DID88_007434 [Monilinia fructigena]|uniref:Uncharacterized protein n=1 Tax=Monilinia fructigena TaxID=38457 RepID=A0A395J925_9HELO|nr:hypothetical protein DID88_007434 [Monilinia fructigena]
MRSRMRGRRSQLKDRGWWGLNFRTSRAENGRRVVILWSVLKSRRRYGTVRYGTVRMYEWGYSKRIMDFGGLCVA